MEMKMPKNTFIANKRANVSKTSAFTSIKLLICSLVVLLVIISITHHVSNPMDRNSALENVNQDQTEKINNLASEHIIPSFNIESGTVDMDLHQSHDVFFQTSLPYLRCANFSNVENSEEKMYEILLLHGAKFTKKNWEDSGILESLCSSSIDHSKINVVALDLSVKSDGSGLLDAFEALGNIGILSGRPVVLVTPSASGKSIVSLAHSYSDKLHNVVKIWVPVAPPAVLSPTEENSLKSFVDANIPVLAINGNTDQMGKKVTERLVKFTGATGIELNGGHPCYLDSPEAFVSTLIDFIRKNDSVIQ